MFSNAETPMWRALRLFDTNLIQPWQSMLPILQDNGWFLTSHGGHSQVLMKNGCELVFKLYDPEHDLAYSAFAHRLRQPDITIESHPHLPRLYRYRPGVVLLEKLQPRIEPRLFDDDDRGTWAGWVLLMIDVMLKKKDALLMANNVLLFEAEHPALRRSLELILQLPHISIVIKPDDVLQRADGTPVIIDPIT